MKVAYLKLFVILTYLLVGMALPAARLNAALLPMEMLAGNVTYVTGGVGKAEAAIMRNMAKEFQLEISFGQKLKQQAEFLAGVKVRIYDEQQNTLLDITTDGPFLLANMPQGTYMVSAEFNAEVKSQMIDIENEKHKKIEFWWPIVEPLDTDGTLK